MLITPEADIPVHSISLAGLPLLERARLACHTIKVLFPDTENPDEEELELAQEAFKVLTGKSPQFNPVVVAQYPTASLQHLDRLLSEYDYELVNSAVRIREYTKNKLLVESENPDGRIRIKALELLGKMKEVGLFTDRVEVTLKTKTDAELEDELTKKIERYMGEVQVIEAVAPQNEEEDLSEVPDVPEARPTSSISSFIQSLPT